MRSYPGPICRSNGLPNCVATLCVGFDSAHLNVHRSPPETGNLGINLCGHPAFRRSCGDEHDGSIHSPAEIRAGARVLGIRHVASGVVRTSRIQDFRSGGRPDVSLDQAGRGARFAEQMNQLVRLAQPVRRLQESDVRRAALRRRDL